MNRTENKRSSPLWIENSVVEISRFSEDSEFSKVSTFAQSRVTLHGTICQLADIKKGLENYTSLSPEDCKVLDNTVLKIRAIIQSDKFDCIGLKFLKITRDFNATISREIDYLGEDLFNPEKKVSDRTLPTYKNLCNFFNSWTYTTFAPYKRSSLNKFERIQDHLDCLTEHILLELKSVSTGLVNISNKKTTKNYLTVVKQDYEAISEEIERYIDFMAPDDQEVLRLILTKIENGILDFETDKSPESSIEL